MIKILVVSSLDGLSDSPIYGNFPCRKFQLSDGRWCFHVEENQPTEAEVLAIINPSPAQRKVFTYEQAKASLTAKDPPTIRLRSTARLQLKILRRFANAITDPLVTAGTITQPQANAIKNQIPGWPEFQIELAKEIDDDAVSR